MRSLPRYARARKRELRLVPVCFALFSAACGADPAAQSGIAPALLPDAGAAMPGAMSTPSNTNTGTNTGIQPGVTNQAAPGAAGSSTCESHVVDGAPAVPDMLIVLDRSGSMNPDNNDDATDRWGGSRDALIDVTEAFDHQVRFGLMTFPGVAAGGGGDSQCAPGKLDVPIGLNTGPSIATTLGSMQAEGRTPTAAALEAALPIVATSVGPDEVAGAKYVLLVTDGDPNCGSNTGGRGGGGRDDVARMATIRAIEALTAAGVKTFVVGYQTAGTDFVDQLDRMAAAGGTGATKHTSVESGSDLNATLSQIASKLVSCTYQLKGAVADPAKVLVSVAGRPRNLNAADDGWRLESDHRTVTLLGRACMEVESGGVFAVQVTCEPVPIF